jgi:hypothetical protein
MTGPSDRNDPQSRAQAVFTASEQRDKSVRAEIEKERAATDAKTARLKALRLAREAEEAAEAAANPKPAKKAKATKKKA